MTPENRNVLKIGALATTLALATGLYVHKVNQFEPYEPEPTRPTPTSSAQRLQGRPLDVEDLAATLRGDTPAELWEEITSIQVHKDAIVLNDGVQGIIPTGARTNALLTYVESEDTSSPLGVAVVNCETAGFVPSGPEVIMPEACLIPIQNVGTSPSSLATSNQE